MSVFIFFLGCEGKFSRHLRVAQVLAIDFGQRRESSNQQLIVLFSITEQRIGLDKLVLLVLHLVERVVIENDCSEEFWVVELDHFENGDQGGHLVERDVKFTQRLTARQRVQIRDCTLRSRQSLKKWTVSYVQLSQFTILIQIEYFNLWQTELSRKIAQLIDIEVELGQEDEFVLGCLKGVNVSYLVLSKFDELEHLAI